MSRLMTRLEDWWQLVRAVLVCRVARFSTTRTGVVLVYHRVGGQAPGDPSREILAAVSSEVFERQLRHLRQNYRVVPATDLLRAVRTRRRGGRFPIALTFDDDLASHVRAALPALQRARLHATFFLGGNSLREPHPFWWEDLQQAIDARLVQPDSLPYIPETVVGAALQRSPKAIFRVAATIETLEPPKLDEVAAALRTAVAPRVPEDGLRNEDVQSLIAGGFDVGFHTLRHEALPTLSDTELKSALEEGRDVLTAVAGRRLNTICYPHGKFDARVVAAVRAAGFRYGFTTRRARVTADTDPLLIPRLPPTMSVGKTALRIARAVAHREAES